MSERVFRDRLEPDQQAMFDTITGWLKKHEPGLEASMGEVMGGPFLKLDVAGMHKYGFTCGRHLTFHSWVMYCNPDIREKYAGNLGVPKSRVRKSCINLKPGDKLDEATFNDMFRAGVNRVCADY